MALRGTGTRTVALAWLVALAGTWPAPATAATIVVTPDAPHPGQRVHISVPGCSTGRTAHTAVSAAFPSEVVLHGKADTGDADITLRTELKPGTYPVIAHCGASTVQGRIAIVPGTMSGHDDDSPNYWLLAVPAVVLAAIAGAFVLLRRRG
jgi:hypothetical protein